MPDDDTPTPTPAADETIIPAPFPLTDPRCIVLTVYRNGTPPSLDARGFTIHELYALFMQAVELLNDQLPDMRITFDGSDDDGGVDEW